MINPLTRQTAKNIIKQGEGCKLKAYLDTEGYPTIGYGHKINPGQNYKQISKQKANQLLEKDMQIAIKRAKNVIGQNTFNSLSNQRQAALIDLAFNLGEFNFQKFIQGIKQGNFNKASLELLQSKYRTQVKIRAYRNALIIKQDKIFTKSQAQDKCINIGLLQKNKNGILTYSNQIKDPRIKNILNQTNPLNSDAQMAKQFDKIKKMVGGVSFDIDPITTRLNGFISQNQTVKMIEGDQYDTSSYSLMDLVTPLKIMYDQNIHSKNISVSLDPLVPTDPDGPWYRKTFYPKQLENTQYGQAMIEADFLMKQLSLGVDKDNKPFQYPERLKQMGLQIQTIFKSIQQKSYGGNRTRLWIVIKDYQIGVNQKFFQVKKVVMGVQLKALQVTLNGSLRDCTDDPSPLAKRFCQIFTKNYQQLSQIYPILAKTKRLAKASIIAKLMYLRRVPVNFQLINRQYNNEKCQYQPKVARLHNTLRKQNGDKLIQLTVLGGCSFDISNIQTKINELQQQIEQIREIYYTKQDTKAIPFKFSEKQNVGQFFFVKDQKEEIKNNKLFPFLFQSLVKCKHCQKTCNLDYYSITNQQCYDHSTMKCKICKNLILPSQKYKSNPDKSMVFHDRCFKCAGCQKDIQGQFANYQGSTYHTQCIPKKTIGVCQQCKKVVYQNQAHAKDPKTLAVYHAQCANIVNKRVQDSIPSCKQCKVKIQAKYVKYQGEIYHQECIKKKLNLK